MNKSDLEPNEAARYRAIEFGMNQYQKFKDKVTNHDHIVIVNMLEPSYRKRLYILNDKHEVIRNHHVCHGANSANPWNVTYANSFSNKKESHQSSLGAMVTSWTYEGNNGRSLKLHGLEKGINSNVFERAIVVHGSNYATNSYILKHGRCGLSWGCPAMDKNVVQGVIDIIKGGCFFYVYYDKNA